MPIVVVPDRRVLREPLAYRPIRDSRETSELGLVLSSPPQAVSILRSRVKAEVNNLYVASPRPPSRGFGASRTFIGDLRWPTPHP